MVTPLLFMHWLGWAFSSLRDPGAILLHGRGRAWYLEVEGLPPGPASSLFHILKEPDLSLWFPQLTQKLHFLSGFVLWWGGVMWRTVGPYFFSVTLACSGNMLVLDTIVHRRGLSQGLSPVLYLGQTEVGCLWPWLTDTLGWSYGSTSQACITGETGFDTVTGPLLVNPAGGSHQMQMEDWYFL